MIVQDYILLILNCEKYKDKALKQKQTWLPAIPTSLLYFHVIGNPKLNYEYLFLLDENILYVKCEDDYNSLPKKIMSALCAIKTTYKFKYVFKTDDDQMVVKPAFFETLMNVLNHKSNTNISSIHYGGFIVNVTHPHISQYYRIHPELPRDIIIQPIRYCNGRFYFLSKEAILSLLEHQSSIEDTYLEDYAIGLYLPSFLKENMMNIKTNDIFIDFS